MKHLLTLTLLVCLGTFASAQIPSYVPTNGLVGWWPFNGNANDESGNGNHGTVNGATLAADRFGNPGKAYSFDGVDDNITISHDSIFNFESTNSFTFSYWIQVSSLSNSQLSIILSKQTGKGPSQDGFNSSIEIDSTSNFRIMNGISTPHFDISSSLIQTNQLYHVVQTFNRNEGKIFLNGTLINSQNGIATVGDNPSDLKIGEATWIETNVKNFDGKIDDIAIYNRALTAAEVQQLYLGNSSNTPAASTVPGKINYQGLAVGANGKTIKNGTVGLRLSVLDSLPNGSALYTETKTASTDAAGIFSTYLGGGTATAGTFANIPWANGNDKFLKVEMDAQGGSNYQPMGTTQLVSVPYALHAGSAEISKKSYELMDSAGNAYQIKIVNGQPTLVAAPGNNLNPGTFACGQSVSYAGESYPTVQIGTQCWFQKNVNVGTMVLGANDQTNNGILEKYCYNNDTANCTIYGGLYQWAEAVQYQNGASNTTSPSPAFTGNVKGICPTGWHVSSDGEYCTLTTFLDATVNCGAFGWSGTDAGGKMKSTSGLWGSPNSGATTNSSGFFALPGGYRSTNGTFTNRINTVFWSSSESFYRQLEYFTSNIDRYSGDKNNGFSVRCLKD